MKKNMLLIGIKNGYVSYSTEPTIIDIIKSGEELELIDFFNKTKKEGLAASLELEKIENYIGDKDYRKLEEVLIKKTTILSVYDKVILIEGKEMKL